MKTHMLICTAVILLTHIRSFAAEREHPWQVGAASVVITPHVAADAAPVWLAGYGPNRPAEAVHDDIYARAIVIGDGRHAVAMVSCDLIGLFRDEVLRIRRGIDAANLTPRLDYVLIGCTHTHAGPDSMGLWGTATQSGVMPGYLDKVRAACIEAVRQAHRQREPAALRIATADVNAFAELIGDSRLPVVIDSKLTAIQATGAAGKTIVTLVNVPCHPEVLGRRNRRLSSDFPSTMREYLEARFGGLAVYNSGALGGLLAPRKPATDPFSSEPLPDDQIDEMMAYGRIIGRIAGDALDEAEPLRGKLRVRSREAFCPVWNDGYQLAMMLGKVRRSIYDASGKPLTPPAASADEPTSRPAPLDMFIKTEVALIDLGELQIAAIPGELYPELALGRFQRPQEPNADFPNAPLEPAVFELMSGRYKMVIGLANDEIGYIIPQSQWDFSPPFAYGRDKRQYGEINSCGPQTAPLLMGAFELLVRQEPEK